MKTKTRIEHAPGDVGAGIALRYAGGPISGPQYDVFRSFHSSRELAEEYARFPEEKRREFVSVVQSFLRGMTDFELVLLPALGPETNGEYAAIGAKGAMRDNVLREFQYDRPPKNVSESLIKALWVLMDAGCMGEIARAALPVIQKDGAPAAPPRIREEVAPVATSPGEMEKTPSTPPPAKKARLSVSDLNATERGHYLVLERMFRGLPGAPEPVTTPSSRESGDPDEGTARRGQRVSGGAVLSALALFRVNPTCAYAATARESGSTSAVVDADGEDAGRQAFAMRFRDAARVGKDLLDAARGAGEIRLFVSRLKASDIRDCYETTVRSSAGHAGIPLPLDFSGERVLVVIVPPADLQGL